jgi:hypothetical protein
MYFNLHNAADHCYHPSEGDRSILDSMVDPGLLHIESVGPYREIHLLFLAPIDKFPN